MFIYLLFKEGTQVVAPPDACNPALCAAQGASTTRSGLFKQMYLKEDTLEELPLQSEQV
jgi:hypothetical protein